MWKRISSSSPWRSAAFQLNRSISSSSSRIARTKEPLLSSSPIFSSPFQRTISLFSTGVVSEGKKVEDVMPIATGHEREEIEAELKGIDLTEMDNPVGPFGTEEEPAVVKSVYDRRIVGCPGGEGEDEHDVVWFWLEKGKKHECPVCSQVFALQVVGPGGPPDGHGDDDHH